ncbi:MAG: glycoside hydrolase family 88 protein [Prolixibacteraceae bacterium]|jgi:unsaturated chondroitin disaccharide hydrolase|nr:glycoside hydrolase family 88 protein [Prolixibacteraceae bacterium]
MNEIIKNLLYLLTVLLLVSCGKKNESDISAQIESNVEFTQKQLSLSLEELNNAAMNPRTSENGKLKLVRSSDWTSGFYPGNLWYLYEITRDEKWKEAADHYSMNIEKEQFNGKTHDMGFKLFCSFGNGYRLTGDENYKAILLQGSKTLSSRFNPKVGCIRSWDHNSDKWDFPVIIDNMMNLELLFWASRETRDSSFYKIAVAHAEKTMENHFREDYSCYHVVSYDTITGMPVKKNTHQGYSHESAWARGQAWALYGYTMVYRETGDTRFLDLANHIASFIIDHPRLPVDGVPYWDFDAPGIPNEPRDASAAAVISSALYELAWYVDTETKQSYLDFADKILSSLSSPNYRAELGKNNLFLLKHSVGSKPSNSEVDVPIIYADYYFLEANLRRMKILGNWKESKAKIIIKADDLKCNKAGFVSDRWQKFADISADKQVPVAAGIIGSSLEKGNPEFFAWIKQNHESGLFEFWNHGQLHKRWEVEGESKSEFYNSSVDEQYEFLQQTQKLAREKLNFELTSFGSPYNWCDENTADALARFPELKVWLYPPLKVRSDKIMVNRVPMLNIEYSVHRPNFYHFFNNYYFYSISNVVAIQGHPSSWNDFRMNQYEMIIDYLQAIQVDIIKPSDLIE